LSRDFPADADSLCDKAAVLRLRGNIKWTLCSYHKNRRHVSGQHRVLAAFNDVKEPQVEEWVDVSRSGGYVKMRKQPQFVTVRSTLFWGQRGPCHCSGMRPSQVDDGKGRPADMEGSFRYVE